MRFAGWREQEYAVDNRDDVPVDLNREEPERRSSYTPPVRPAAEPKPEPKPVQPAPAVKPVEKVEPTAVQAKTVKSFDDLSGCAKFAVIMLILIVGTFLGFIFLALSQGK